MRDFATNLMELRSFEREKFKHLQETNLEVVTRQKNVDPAVILQSVGTRIPGELTPGYIRLYNQDFIVEEVSVDGKISTIEPGSNEQLQPEMPTIYADLVKYGLGTIEAITQLANVLQIPVDKIFYSGLKDGRALTSQKISIRGYNGDISSPPALTHAFLKSVCSGKGAMAPGMLKGNRFTIFVRTPASVDKNSLHEAIKQIATNGFANFFGIQRFGNRFLNPQLGKLLCRNELSEATKLFLFEPGPLDLPVFRDCRIRASQTVDNLADALKIFDEFPYSFRYERSIVESLLNTPNDYQKALTTISDQLRFWFYGYSSYLVNLLLSEAINDDADLPDPLPMPLGGDFKSNQICEKFLVADGTKDYVANLRQFSFLLVKPRTLAPWVMPEVHESFFVPEGAIISFTLPKGVYATTFLTSIFKLYEGSPIPEWVQTTPIDTKSTLGIGSVQEALDELKIDISDLKINADTDSESTAE